MTRHRTLLAIVMTLIVLIGTIPTAGIAAQAPHDTAPADVSQTEDLASPHTLDQLQVPTAEADAEGNTTDNDNSSDGDDNGQTPNLQPGKVDKSGVDLRNYNPSSASGDSPGSQSVRVVIRTAGPAETHLSDLHSMGAQLEALSGEQVQATISLDNLDDYRSQSWVEHVSRPETAATNVVSEGVSAINASLVHQQGYTGDNVKVGVLAASGFDLSNSEISSNIAGSKSFTSDGIENNGDHQHGTGVTEVVVDTAPDANLYLANFATGVEYQNAVSWLQSQNVDVIVMSASFFGEPFDGTGTISDTADSAVQNGVVWVNSAGNYGDKHWEGQFTDGDGDNWHNYTTQDETNWLDNRNQMNAGDTVRVTLTWDAWPTTDQDYDLYLVDSAGNEVARSDRTQDGDDEPTETIRTQIPSDGTYGIAVKAYNAAGTHSLELFSWGGETFNYKTPSGSVTAPAAGDQTTSVGAFNHNNRRIPDYSSRGPTNDGDVGVNVLGPTAVSTSAYSGTFSGTSSSAPHVAGVAALIYGKNKSLSQSRVQGALESTALDAGSPGFDDTSGYGYVDAQAAVQDVSQSQPSQTPSQDINTTITQLNGGSFPTIEAFVSVTNGSGGSVTGLTAQNFTVRENGTDVGNITVRRVGTGGSDISSALVIDRSGSMGGGFFSSGALSDAKTAAKQFVSNFGPGDEGMVMSFADTSRIDQRWTRDKVALNSSIDSLSAGGGTALYDSTARAIKQADGRQGRSAVIVLTDGADTASTTHDTQSVINLAQQRDITVYTIGLDVQNPTPLQDMARQTGGTYYDAPSSSDLTSVYQDISQQINEEYKITYTSPRPQSDGTVRVANVTATYQNNQDSDTARYTAPQTQLPTANFTFSRNGLNVTYNASQSTDPDGNITGYFWDFENDGVIDARGQAATHSFATNGTYETKLIVQDNAGANSSVVKSFSVPPSTASGLNVTITQVRDSSFATIEAFVSVENQSRASTTGLVAPNLVSGLTEQNFDVRENSSGVGSITVQQVGTGGTAISSALVIDRSGSMSPTGLPEAKTAAKQFVSNFGPNDEGAVLSFADRSQIDQRWTRNQADLRSAIDALTAGGGTALYDSTAQAIKQADGRQGRSAVIVLTDGRDTASTTHNVQSVVNRAQQNGVTVYTIGLAVQNPSPLKQMAQQTGGTYYAAPNASDLTSVYQDISQQLNEEYKITYTSPRPQADGTVRTVDVTATHQGKQGSDTAQYTAPSTQLPNANYTYSTSGLTVSYDASRSSDPDGNITSYFWDFDNDGVVDAQGQTVTHTFPSNGTYQTKLTVMDNDGANASVVKSIQVSPSQSGGLNVTITQVRDSSFATIEAFVSVENQSRTSTTGLVAPNLVSGLTEQNFDVRENSSGVGSISVQQVGTSRTTISSALVIDRSGSMSPTGLPEAKTAAKQFVSNFGPNDEGAVLSFADRSQIDQRWTRNQADLRSAIDALSAGGGTALYDTTAQAIREADGRQGRSAVIVLTDGRDTASTTHDVQSVINLAQQRGITVYTIGLDVQRSSPLQRLAQQTGGTYHAAPSASDLTSVYQDISQQLNEEYKITYTSPRPQADGTVRTVDVTVTHQGKQGSDTAQYTAPSTKLPDANYTYSTSGLTVSYDASRSSDPDGNITSYFWDFDNDGVVDAQGQTVTHTFPSNGTYQTKLTVMDNDGANASVVKSIQVSPSQSGGLNVSVRQLKDSSFPTIQAFVSVENQSRASTTGLVTPNLVSGLTEQNFDVRENGGDVGFFTVRRVGSGGADISAALAIDRSGSMRFNGLPEAKTAAKQFISNLDANDEATILSFSDQSRIDQRWTRDKTELRTAIDSLRAGGVTALYDTTARAIRQADGRQGRSAVIVLTDGADNASPNNDLQSVISLAQQKGITVYTIGLDVQNPRPLKQMARQTGGTYYAAPSPSDLSSVYQDISQQLGDEYLIEYSSPNSQSDGTTRTVDVTVTALGKQGSDSAQYTAPGTQLPTANYTYSTSGLTVSFDASGSSDPDGSITGYFWDFDNDGVVDAQGQTVTHTFPSNGTYQTKLTVRDSAGANASVVQSFLVTPSQGSSTTAKVVLEGAPNGLKRFTVNLSSTQGVPVASYQGGRLTVQQLSGGAGQSFVEARGADLNDVIGPTNSDIVLLRVEFSGTVSKQTLSKSVKLLEDDNGNSINTSQVTIRLAGNNSKLFTSPLPGSGGQGPPTNLDSDPLYEDINGDGQGTFQDAIALAFVQSSGLTQAQKDALDHDGDGDVDFDDAIDLAFDTALV